MSMMAVAFLMRIETGISEAAKAEFALLAAVLMALSDMQSFPHTASPTSAKQTNWFVAIHKCRDASHGFGSISAHLPAHQNSPTLPGPSP